MLRVAAASVPIPVALPTTLAGFGSTEPARSINRPLEANVAVLRMDHSPVVVVVTMDVLFIGAHLRSLVEQRVGHVLGPEQLIMAASHTHYAPPTDLDKPLLGQADTPWVGQIAALVGDAVLEALAAEPVEVALLHGVGSTDAAVNRRKKRALTLKRGGAELAPTILAPNPRGYVDRGIRLIEFRDERNGLVAVIWSMACHPVSLHDPNSVDAHYVGHVRSEIRREPGAEAVPVLFLQGFAGDCRPFVRERIESARQFLARIAKGPSFGTFADRVTEEAWMDNAAHDVGSIPRRPVVVDRLRAARVTLPRSLFVTSKSSTCASFFGLQLGPIRIVGGSAEFVGEYRELMVSADSGSQWTVGYLDDVFGYAATSEMLNAGGYEVDGFCSHFGVTRVSSNIEAAVLQGFGMVAEALENAASVD